MKRLAALTFALLALQAFSVELDELIKRIPFHKRDWVKNVIELLPEKQLNGFKDYLKLIDLDVNGGHNIAVQNRNVEILESNPCFKELASRFYASLAQEKVDRFVHALNTGDPSTIMSPTINQTAKDVNRKPGWLWAKALDYSKGNANVAMQLIGICGHDDTSQLQDNYFLPRQGYLTETQKTFDTAMNDPHIKMKIKRLVSAYSKNYGGTSAEVIEDKLQEHFAQTFDYSKGVSCPNPGDSFYYPQALSSKADVSSGLKSEIVRYQAPKSGPTAIKAKAYHVLAGAMQACVLRQSGMPDALTEVILKGAVNGYRAGRLCISSLSGYSKRNGESEEQTIERAMQFRKIAHKCIGRTKGELDNSMIYSWNESVNECSGWNEIAQSLPFSNWIDPDLTNDILVRKVRRGVTQRDVSELFHRSFLSKVANKCEGPQFTEGVRTFLATYGSSGYLNPCPSEWSQERCKKARDLMATYAIDFEWTEAQHLAGFEFAKQHCEPFKPGMTLNSVACNALKNSSGPAESVR